MNIAIVDSVTRFIQRVSHFDTYEEGDSLILSQMVMWECVNRLLSSILAATWVTQAADYGSPISADSSQLEALLLNLRQGDILILLTFDEPTRK